MLLHKEPILSVSLRQRLGTNLCSVDVVLIGAFFIPKYGLLNKNELKKRVTISNPTEHLKGIHIDEINLIYILALWSSITYRL